MTIRRSAIWAVSTGLSLFLMGCGNGVHNSFSAKDVEAIRQVGVAYARNANTQPRSDSASAASYAENAIVFPPNQAPVEGRAAIKKFLLGHPPFSDYRLDTEEIQGEGDLAFERGTASMTLRPSDSAVSPWRVRYLVIWRRQADKSWKIYREMFIPEITSPPSASAPTRP